MPNWTLARLIVKSKSFFFSTASFTHTILCQLDRHQHDLFRVASFPIFPTLIVRAIARINLLARWGLSLKEWRSSSRVESSPREISLAGLSSRRDLEREPRTPVIVIARLGPSLACSRSSSGRTSRVGGCRRKLAGVEKQRKREGKREGRTKMRKEEEEAEGESLTPAAKRRTPPAIHQSRPRRFFRRNNHRTDSYRSLRAFFFLSACLSAFLPLARSRMQP